MPDFRRTLIQRLESLQRAGVQQAARVSIVSAADTPSKPPSESAKARIPAQVDPIHPPVFEPRASTAVTRPMPKSLPASLREDSLVLKAYSAPLRNIGDRQSALETLRCRVQTCQLCKGLASYRTQTVFGVGSAQPRVVFFGEAPGADEDKQGEPFVGRAGQLLTKIIEACGWKREDVYILNTLKCRPPDNRTPAEDEIANCRPFWEQQLEVLHPEFVVCLGAVAAQALLETTVSVGKLRGKFHRYRDSQVVATYHPAYLLRNPDAKRFVWEDMQMLMGEMGLEVPKRPAS